MTVTDTIAEALPPRPSSTAYENVSVPENPNSGVYRRLPSPATATTPWAACVNDAMPSASPSGSLSLVRTDTSIGVSCTVCALSATATGGRLGGLIGKAWFDTSLTSGLATHITRASAADVTQPAWATMLRMPSADALGDSTIGNVVPPFVERSIRTDSNAPKLLVQLMD